MPAVPATPGKVCPKAVPPNQAALASPVCVAQKPWVRVTPWPVFSNTHVTVSPIFSVTVAVCVFRSPVPVLPPLPVTVQLNAEFGSPPIPVRIHPAWVNSVTVYVPALSVWLFCPPPGSVKEL